jgi:hypothetical protein
MFEGVIYKITGSCGKVYIGSTCDYSKRKYSHHYNTNNTASNKLLKPLQFEKIRTDNYNLIKTMLLLEQYYIDIYKCVNKQRAYHNKFTLRKYKSEYDKYYLQKNKEELHLKRNVKIHCSYCKCLINKSNIKAHQKTPKCLKLRLIII